MIIPWGIRSDVLSGSRAWVPVATAAAASITLTATATYAVLVAGTYTGTPTGIEAQFAGQGWVEIDASPSGGTFSAYLTGLTADTGTLEVRHADDTDITDSEGSISLGAVAGGASPRVGDRTGGLR